MSWICICRLVNTTDILLQSGSTENRKASLVQYLRRVTDNLPQLLLQPIAGTAEAVSSISLGFRNQIDPGQRRDEEDIWAT